MKILVIVLSLLNGGWMLLDGIFVLIRGKYIGPPKPGPWAGLFYKLQVDVFKLGPLFILFGATWLLFMAGLWMGQAWAWKLGIVISILSLWYLPVGTVISIIVLIVLFTAKSMLG